MEPALIVFRQTLTMAVYMLLGFVLFRTGKITKEGSKSMANVLVWLVIPTVIIDSFCVPYSREKLAQLGISALLAAGALAISILVSRLIYPQKPIENFAAAFSNCGFMGIPLVRAGFGDEAVFLLVGFVVLLNLLQWTYGASLLQGKRVRLGAKALLINPIAIGTGIGLLLFLTGLGNRLPGFAQGAVSGVAGLNSPVAMIVLGIYLAQTELRKTFLSPRLYGLSGVRLLLIPALTLLPLIFLPVAVTVKFVILVAAAAPVGANVAVYAQLYNQDYPYACQTVALSTVLSILTLPVAVAVAGLLF